MPCFVPSLFKPELIKPELSNTAIPYTLLSALLVLSACKDTPQATDETANAVQEDQQVQEEYLRNGKPDYAYLSIPNDDPSIVAEQWPPKQFPGVAKSELTGPGTVSPAAPQFPIVDIHEHAQTERDVKLLIDGMDRFGIQTTCLMSSTTYTFTLNNQYGFEGYETNNEDILRYKEMYPGRLCAFITIDPAASGNLERVKDYVAKGADGIKLYLGHGASHGKGPFHVMDLDDPRMLEIYKYAESIQLPILMHVNLIKYMDELVNVLEEVPYLRLCVPHFGLHKNTAERLNRLGWLFDRYPNFYTDMSFGFHTFHKQGFEAFARWRSRSSNYFQQYASRIMYATDMVLEKGKDAKHVDEVLRSYMQFLETDKFRFFMAENQLMHGLDLAPDVLQEIYVNTPRSFLQMNDKGELKDRSAVVASPTLEGLPPSVENVIPLKEGEGPP